MNEPDEIEGDAGGSSPVVADAGPPSASGFTLSFAGPVDDDVRVRINGVAVYDPARNVGWYAGAGWQTVPHPDVVVSQRLREGDRIAIDCMDGWATGYRLAAWTLRLHYPKGDIVLTGGADESYSPVHPAYYSLLPPPPGGWNGANYYAQPNGPHFRDYHPMGEVVVPAYPFLY